MRVLMISVLVAALLLVAGTVDAASDQSERIEREGTEWCDIWITHANQTDKPRVLLVGDSIARNYYSGVEKRLADTAHIGRFTTSACLGDPAFYLQLEAVLSGYDYAVIHFNNGLHGIGYTEEEYRAGYERALKLIQTKQPKAKLVVAPSTPLQSTSDENRLNPWVDGRNVVARAMAKTFGATVNDLHCISKGHPEYYRDAYHYKPEAIELQAQQVAETVTKVLNSAREDGSDRK